MWAASRRTNELSWHWHYIDMNSANASAPLCKFYDWWVFFSTTLLQAAYKTRQEPTFPSRRLDLKVPRESARVFYAFPTPNRTYCHHRDRTTFIPTAKYIQITTLCDKYRSLIYITCKEAICNSDCLYCRRTSTSHLGGQILRVATLLELLETG